MNHIQRSEHHRRAIAIKVMHERRLYNRRVTDLRKAQADAQRDAALAFTGLGVALCGFVLYLLT